MPIIDISGISHVYDLTPATQSPDVLVFIHGWLLSHQYWHPLIEQLAPRYQCLAYDLRGFGGSCSPAAIQEVLPSVSYSLASYAQDLGQLLERLNLSRVWLVGHSLGGSIALWGAHQFPERVQGVICMNAGGGIYLKEEFDRFRTIGQQIVRLRPRWLAQIPGAELMFSKAGTVRSLSRKWARQRLIDFVAAHSDAALGALLESTTEAEVHRLPQLVAKLHQPLYFIAGAQDSIMEPQYVRHIASFHALFQDGAANVFEIPDCGHLAMLEQPQSVAEIMQTILDQHC